MDSKLLQTLRYRLQNRLRRLKSVDWQFYHWQLVQFWTFLNSHIVFKTILKLLEEEKTEVFDRVKPLLEGSSPRDTVPVFDDEKDQAAAAYFVVKDCIQTPATHAQNQKELHIGERYTHSTKFPESIDAFTRIFVMPLYEYLDEQLDSRNILLYLLVRYKHVSEWFRRESLLKRYNDAESRKGEKVLASDLYEFLYSQGLDFHIEPTSATGEIDLISEQVGDERLLLDAKVFTDNTSNVKSGFRQIYTYTTDYNQPFGCLAIFNVGDKELSFSSQHDDPQFGIFSVNGKTIFMITIDISDKPSASKRGTLKPIILTEQDLIQSLGEGSLDG
ncbi:MAG: hypothetical protein ACLQPD_06485 [Desulfomonilaceae bacterium]